MIDLRVNSLEFRIKLDQLKALTNGSVEGSLVSGSPTAQEDKKLHKSKEMRGKIQALSASSDGAMTNDRYTMPEIDKDQAADDELMDEIIRDKKMKEQERMNKQKE